MSARYQHKAPFCLQVTCAYSFMFPREHGQCLRWRKWLDVTLCPQVQSAPVGDGTQACQGANLLSPVILNEIQPVLSLQ